MLNKHYCGMFVPSTKLSCSIHNEQCDHCQLLCARARIVELEQINSTIKKLGGLALEVHKLDLEVQCQMVNGDLSKDCFQDRMDNWMQECFGEEISKDCIERNHRFLEESLELVQACECTADEAHQLVDYVFNRPVGDKYQEVGGVVTTLSALCTAQSLDMHKCSEIELSRIFTKIPQIRDKQAQKPKHSPLPIAYEHVRPMMYQKRGYKATVIAWDGTNTEQVVGVLNESGDFRSVSTEVRCDAQYIIVRNRVGINTLHVGAHVVRRQNGTVKIYRDKETFDIQYEPSSN